MLAKLSEAKEHFDRSPLDGLRFASRLNCLGPARNAIQTGWSAHQNPRFYLDLGKDPQALVEAGLLALKALLRD